MIFTADNHLRLSVPRARRDDFTQAMEKKLRFILGLARQSPPLIVAGDFLDVARSDQELEQWLIGLLREYQVEIICVPGQHELPDHSLSQYKRSSLAVLEAAGVIRVLSKKRGPFFFDKGWAAWGCAWGETPDKSMQDQHHRNMFIWHKMVTADPLWPTQEIVQPGRLLREYPWYDLIVTGDNHQTVLEATNLDGYGKVRRLINPGSMMRQTAAQVDHKPCVFSYETNENGHGLLWRHDLPTAPDVIDLSQLQEKKARDGRIEVFVERLETPAELGLEFEANLKAYLEANPVRESVKQLIWRMVG